MNATTLLLSGEPHTEPSFLATVEPSTFHQPPPFTLPFELVLTGYTREAWSSGKSGGISGDWQCCYLVSTDGKKRLPGFFQYLQERKKAAIAKFEAADALFPSNNNTSCCGKAILVIPYDPPPMPTEVVLPSGVDKSEVIFVKYLRDENILKRDDMHVAQKVHQRTMEQQQKIMMHEMQQQQPRQQQQQNTIHHQSQLPQTQKKLQTEQPAVTSSLGTKGGCLGKLLGAQRRTESHLDMVRSRKGNNATFDPNTGAAGCINQFRNKISKELQLFKSDPTAYTTKFPISHSSLIKNVPLDEQDKVTFNVFKFTVYEQVDEIGMGQWIAAKEPSEFLDECIITVYKNGHCPVDVLDEINRGDLPDEIKGQARHMVESQSKAIVRKGKKQDEQIVKDTIVGEDNVVVLNANKRDRRTLEQIQKDLQGESEDVKRGRFA
ncbi:hypothetical protein ACHAXH_007760 [Discostella pseudostelligera]